MTHGHMEVLCHNTSIAFPALQTLRQLLHTYCEGWGVTVTANNTSSTSTYSDNLYGKLAPIQSHSCIRCVGVLKNNLVTLMYPSLEFGPMKTLL